MTKDLNVRIATIMWTDTNDGGNNARAAYEIAPMAVQGIIQDLRLPIRLLPKLSTTNAIAHFRNRV